MSNNDSQFPNHGHSSNWNRGNFDDPQSQSNIWNQNEKADLFERRPQANTSGLFERNQPDSRQLFQRAHPEPREMFERARLETRDLFERRRTPEK